MRSSPNASALWSAAALAAVLLTTGCGRQDVKVTETEVSVLEDTPGRGKPARPGDIVCIDFRVLLPDEEEILWGTDFCFELGAGVVIAGFDEAIPGMRAGGRRRVRCPPHKHWGRPGYGKELQVPPRTNLTLDIKLVSVEPNAMSSVTR